MLLKGNASNAPSVSTSNTVFSSIICNRTLTLSSLGAALWAATTGEVGQ